MSSSLLKAPKEILLSKSANKRSEYLKKISWEHHQVLRYALHIKKGVAKNTDGRVLADYVKAVADQHLTAHFAEEEQALFSRLNAEQKENPALQQVLKEHQELPLLAAEISNNQGSDKTQILQFSAAIVSHVKLEEKTLFPFIERVLSKQVLQEAQTQIEKMHSSNELNWSNEFWKSPTSI
jgi:hemerythrin-like domain-containing protein